MNDLKVGLFVNRHPLPSDVTDYIFEEETNPLKPDDLEKKAYMSLQWILAEKYKMTQTMVPTSSSKLLTTLVYPTDIPEWKYNVNLCIYITGLTVALVAAIKAGLKLCTNVTLLHYNKETGGYYPQYL